VVCISTDDVLFAFCVSPLYEAVSDADPNGSLVVTRVAVAVESSLPVPRVVVPFLNVTVPVGPLGALELTFAVRVTLCPTKEGFDDEVKPVAVLL